MTWRPGLHVVLFIPLFLLAIAPRPLQATTFQVRPVVLQGDPAPGGGTFTQLITRSSTGVTTPLNDAGTVAFGAAVQRGSQSSSGIFSWTGGTLTSVVQQEIPPRVGSSSCRPTSSVPWSLP